MSPLIKWTPFLEPFEDMDKMFNEFMPAVQNRQTGFVPAVDMYEDKNYYRKEIRTGSFYRSVPLPAHVIGEKASATASDGVLKIVIPKAPITKPKKIKIQTKHTG